MAEAQQRSRERSTIKVVALIREYLIPPATTQKKVIEKYVANVLGAVVADYITIAREHRNFEYSTIYFKLKQVKADVLIVYSWSIIGVRCKTLVKNLSAIFRAGIKVVHQAYNGDKITIDDWNAHKEFLAKFFFVPTSKTQMLPNYLVEVLDSLPLTVTEIRDLYNIITKKIKVTLPTNEFQAAVEAGALEIITSELRDRTLSEHILPKHVLLKGARPEETLFKEYKKRRRYNKKNLG